MGYDERLSGWIGDPNAAAYYLLTLGLLVVATRQRPSTALLFGVFIVGSVYLTLSRTGIGIVLVSVVWLLVVRRLRLAGALAVVAAVAWVLENVPEDLRLWGPFAAREGSDALRQRIIAAEQVQLDSAPFWGNGPGATKVNVSGNEFFFHSSYYSVLNEGGKPLVVLLLVLIAATILVLGRRADRDWRVACLQMALIAPLLMAFTLGEVLLDLPVAVAIGMGLYRAYQVGTRDRAAAAGRRAERFRLGTRAADDVIEALRSWAATASGRAVLTVVLVAELGVLGFATATGIGPFGDNDADIYLAAVRGWIDGDSLYAYVNAGGFGFTYPPFAALLFAPVALLPLSLGGAAFTVAAVAAAVATVRIVLKAEGRPEWGETLLLSCGLLVLYPVFREYASGQIDLVLVLAVVVDVLLLPRTRYAGVLVGVAAAVKLTPAVFLLLLALRMGPMAALRAAGAALAVTLVAWLVAPATSREYWTDRLWDTSNVGDQTAALNQSLAAVVARFADPPDGRLSGAAALVWIVLVLALVVAVAAWLWRTRERGVTVASLVVVAVLGPRGLARLVAPPLVVAGRPGAVPVGPRRRLLGGVRAAPGDPAGLATPVVGARWLPRGARRVDVVGQRRRQRAALVGPGGGGARRTGRTAGARARARSRRGSPTNVLD